MARTKTVTLIVLFLLTTTVLGAVHKQNDAKKRWEKDMRTTVTCETSQDCASLDQTCALYSCDLDSNTCVLSSNKGCCTNDHECNINGDPCYLSICNTRPSPGTCNAPIYICDDPPPVPCRKVNDCKVTSICVSEFHCYDEYCSYTHPNPMPLGCCFVTSDCASFNRGCAVCDTESFTCISTDICPSPSPSPSFVPSSSSTNSPSSTPSTSSTATPTVSTVPTTSPSISATRSAEPSQEPTPSFSTIATPSPSQVATVSPTIALSPVPTLSPTISSSQTSLATESPSAEPSASSAITPTSHPTPSASKTSSGTPALRSPPPSNPVTPSVFPTRSPFPSQTPTSPATLSFSSTPGDESDSDGDDVDGGISIFYWIVFGFVFLLLVLACVSVGGYLLLKRFYWQYHRFDPIELIPEDEFPM